MNVGTRIISDSNRVNCGSILINNTFLPDVGIKIFSLSLRSAASAFLWCFRLRIRMEMPFAFQFLLQPTDEVSFSLSGFADSIKIT